VPRLIDVQPILAGQGRQQLLVGPLQRLADLGEDLGQLTSADGNADHVAQELADGGEGGVTDALEVRDQGGQPRAEQAPRLDGCGQGRLVEPGAVVAPVPGAGVLLDGQRGLLEVDLLHHLG
jgi:hypothetical protein